MTPDLTRRMFTAGAAALAVLPAMPALALTEQQAVRQVNTLIADINAVIASGKSERAMYGDFERIFRRYGDIRVIAATVLGVDGRRASNAQKSAFTDAFTGYVSRKYGSRFRNFIGGQLEIEGVRQIRRGYEVRCIAYLRQFDPFRVSFFISDSQKFYNIFVEGVDMLLTERTEIGAMLDARRGNIDQLIADLRTAAFNG